MLRRTVDHDRSIEDLDKTGNTISITVNLRKSNFWIS